MLVENESTDMDICIALGWHDEIMQTWGQRDSYRSVMLTPARNPQRRAPGPYLITGRES